MSSAASVVSVAGIALALGGAACLPISDPPAGPPCVTGYEAGQVLTMRLGTIYDAKSDYYYDGSVEPVDWPPSYPSCAGVDGLTTDTSVTFTMKKLLAVDVSGGGCDPWWADFTPEAAQATGVITSNYVPQLPGITIAAAFREGVLGGRAMVAHRGLFTPSRDPQGPLVARQPPPLVVTREITWNDGMLASCFDAWVASWEPAP